ncbi:glycosyltransferase family 87 protein [Streptomyces sp. NPDC002004]
MAGGKAPVWEWLASRVVLMLIVFGVLSVAGGDGNEWDLPLYQKWFDVFQTGSFPSTDVAWQYPPAAALIVLAPGLLPFLSYASGFLVLACVADAVVFALLVRAGRLPGRRMTGAWVWTVGLPLLGPVSYGRLDVMVTAVTVAALLALPVRPGVGGALAGLGALLKVWSALALLGTKPGESARRAWASAILTVIVCLGGFAALMPGSLSFLTSQRDRGVQIESLVGLGFHIARRAGWPGWVQNSYGAVEFAGPGVTAAASCALALNGLALAWVALWRLRARTFTDSTPALATLAAVLPCILTSRVFSPQYMIWLIGLAAVCGTWGTPRLKLPTALILAASAVTLVIFPFSYTEIIESTPYAIVLLLVRDGLLLAATFLIWRQLWRTTVTSVNTRHWPPRQRHEQRADHGAAV